MGEDIDEIMKTLKKYSQEHLLNRYSELDQAKQKKLLEQIKAIDFELINSLYNNTKRDYEAAESEITPIEYLDKEKLNGEYKDYQAIGEKAIRNGELAAVTMAGGQGTRLGHNGPKGTYDIGLETHKSLFELLSDTLKEQGKKYGVVIPWFIMTSEENNEQTIEFFTKHRYFGHQKDKDLFFFKQGELPMVDTEGKILIGEDGLIKEAADGHGGIYESLVKRGMTKKMRELGTKWVFIGGIDNCLVKMVDPILMGIAIQKNVTAAGKSVVKANPQEKVGVFCKKNGRPSVLEYTEIPKELSEEIDENGELKYGESHILCNLFKLDAIERMGAKPLPYHSAFKKATYIDKEGNKVIPDGPNAYKFEAFLFDAFGELDDMAILRVKREEEFAPVKNATGVDSPETARELYRNFYKL
ncbi:MAG: UDPGP type 1 family protein [Clostridia bacterium]|nr:UDPGP type 1 family protein [Clostridia bacterium]